VNSIESLVEIEAKTKNNMTKGQRPANQESEQHLKLIKAKLSGRKESVDTRFDTSDLLHRPLASINVEKSQGRSDEQVLDK